MIGVKELISKFSPKINWDKKAKDKAKEEDVSKEDILKEWEEAKEKGIRKGNALHIKKQSEYNEEDNYVRYTYQKHDDTFVYNHSNYIIENGYVYDEKPFVHYKFDIIGIPDRVIVKDNVVDIYDFKSDKAIYKVAKTFRNGKFFTKQKMLSPIAHIDYCNYMIYNLQLSFYMKLILDNNKNLKPGKLFILHTLHNEDTLEALEEITYEVPYLRKEITAILKTIKK